MTNPCSCLACRHLAPECRRGFDDRNRRRGPGDDNYVRFKLYRKEFSVPEDQLWRLILPAAGVLGLAAFLGESCFHVNFLDEGCIYVLRLCVLDWPARG